MKPKSSAFFTGTLIQTAAAAAILGLAGKAQADTMYFSAAGGPYTWGTDPVWSGTSSGPYDQAWGAWNDAVFEGTGGTVNVSGTQSVNGMTFTVDGYQFNGGTLQLGGLSGGAPITVGTGLSATIQSDIIDTYTGMLKDGAGSLTLTGAVNLGTHSLTINAGTLQIGTGGSNGSLAAGSIVNNGTLIYSRDASSTVSLPSGGISGSGNLSATAGVIQFNGNITQGGSLSFTQTGGGSLYTGLELAASTTLTGSSITLSGDVGKRDGDGNSLALDTSAANGTINLDISLGRSGLWYVPSGFSANAGTGTINITGSGTDDSGWRDTPVTLTGAVNMTAGVNSNAAVTIDSNTTTTGTVSGALSGGLSLTKSGAGTLTLSGSNAYSGTTTINAGTLKAGSGSAFSNNGALTLTGGTLDLNGYNAAFTGVTSATNAATVTDSSAGSGTSTLTLNNAAAVGANIADGASRKVALRITNENGVFSLAGSNSFSGGIVLANTANGTRMDAGTTSGGACGTGPITIGEAAADQAQIIFGTANQTLSNHLIVNTANGTDVDGAVRVECTNLTLSGTITANLADFQIGAFFGGRSVALTGPIDGNSGLHVANAKYYGTAQNGAITVTLNNVGIENSYAGETTVDAYETLVLGSADQIPNGVGKGNVTVNGALNLGGNSETINGLSGAGTVDGGSSTLTLGDGDATGNFGGTITGLALTKIGSGTQTLAGSSTLNGITLTGGTLSLGEGSTAASFAVTADVIVDSGCTLNLNYSGTASINALWLGGVQKSPGVYGSGNSGGLITGTGTLTVTNGPFASDYDTWGSAYGLSAGSEGGDLDNDGLTNGEEHAFGLIPNSGSSVNPITSQLSKTSGQFSYQRRDNGLTGLTYTIWYSTDLSSWTEDTGALQPDGTPDGNGVEIINVTLSNLPGDPLPAKLFIQVRAQ